jgi:terminase large subunit-like protein
MNDIRYTPPPTVRRFMRSNQFVRAIVGPLGSGKSSGCVLEILKRSVEQKPGPDGVRRTRFAVIRNTRPQLQDTTRKTFEQWIPESVGAWHEQDFSFTIDRPLADGTRLNCEVLFRALDKPKDVRKVLSLELTGAYLNEAREIPKEVVDGLQGRVGRYPSKSDGGATWFGIWMDTNPWHVGSWGYKLFSKDKPTGFELFEQPSGLSPEAENVENLPAGYYERLIHGKDSEWVDEYIHGKYPLADKGSIYGALIDKLDRAGGICDFSHPSDGVFASFDLGISDATAIWFWRLNNHGVPDLIDWYEATGEPLSHYFDVLDSRGYKYEKIWLPHDARAKTLQTGASTLDQFIKRYGTGLLSITPELSIADGIAATRWMFEQPVRIHARCEGGVELLRAYRYRWDDDKKVFSKTPLHDFSSNTADAARYVACAVRNSDLATRRPAVVVKPLLRSPDSFTLEELFEMRGDARKGSRL